MQHGCQLGGCAPGCTPIVQQCSVTQYQSGLCCCRSLLQWCGCKEFWCFKCLRRAVHGDIGCQIACISRVDHNPWFGSERVLHLSADNDSGWTKQNTPMTPLSTGFDEKTGSLSKNPMLKWVQYICHSLPGNRSPSYPGQESCICSSLLFVLRRPRHMSLAC